MLTVMLVVQEHAEDALLPAPFQVNLGLIIWTWIVFVGLFLLLRKYAFPPIIRLTEERERKIASQLEGAQRANAEAQAALAEHKALLAGSKEEAGALLAEAKLVAQKEREHLLEKTREEQQQLLDRAKREIEAERDRAVVELRREAVDLSLAAASKLIQARLDTDADRKLVEDYLRTLGSDS
jgi:F-type H+-transporting ATPase subunit b